MKTLILNGSPRKKGVTNQILSKMEEGAAQKGEVNHIRLYGSEIKPCVGCLNCRPDKECILPEDDGQRIARMIKEADILILGSPTYWGNITGPMKTFFDRCVTTFEFLEGHSIPKKLHRGKKSLIVTASNAPAGYHLLPSQSRSAVRAMKTILRAGGFRIGGVINVPDSGNFDKKAARILKRAAALTRSVTK